MLGDASPQVHLSEYSPKSLSRVICLHSMQVLPPTVNNGVNADSGYDAEGISLIADPDENASLNNSDDEGEDAG